MPATTKLRPLPPVPEVVVYSLPPRIAQSKHVLKEFNRAAKMLVRRLSKRPDGRDKRLHKFLLHEIKRCGMVPLSYLPWGADGADLPRNLVFRLLRVNEYAEPWERLPKAGFRIPMPIEKISCPRDINSGWPTIPVSEGLKILFDVTEAEIGLKGYDAVEEKRRKHLARLKGCKVVHDGRPQRTFPKGRGKPKVKDRAP